jgi:hypothetical protein
MIALPYWIADTLAATPAFLWIFFGLGIPWALVLLPRADWGDALKSSRWRSRSARRC